MPVLAQLERINNRTAWKAIGGSGCLILVLWLAFQGSPTQRRRALIDKMLKRGEIGQITTDQTSWLYGTLTWMAGAAGVKEPIALNAPFRSGQLQVFTTTPEAVTVTHCDRGNAVYDAQLDTIFLDRDLFDSKNFQTFLSSTAYGNLVSLNDLPFVQTYVRFLLLHELGHRTLHRKRGGVFDFGNSKAATQEQEADDFALTHLQAAYAMPQAVANRVGAAGADLLELPFEELKPAERTLVDLASMVAGMNLSLLFISNPYAPFYHDSAHATFLSRCRGFLQAAREQQSADVRVSASLDAVDELIRREESALGNPLVEILTPDPIADVSFDQNGLLITSVELRRLFHVDGQNLAEFFRAATPANHFRSIWTGPGWGHDIAVDDWWKVDFWSLPRGQTLSWRRDGTILQSAEDGWKEIENSRWSPVTTHAAEHLYIPPQPSAVALAEPEDSDRNEWLSSLAADGLLASRAESRIVYDSRKEGLPPRSSFNVIGVTDTTAYLGIQDTQGRLWGISEMDLATMSMRRSTRLQFPTEANRLTEQTWLAVSPEPSPRFLMVSSNGVDRASGEFLIWELSPTEPPTLLVRSPYFHSKTANLQRAFGGQSIASIDWLSHGKLLLGIGNDSLYVIDLARRTATPVFHPGDEIIKKRVGRNGMVAVFVQGGYKCYVMKLA